MYSIPFADLIYELQKPKDEFSPDTVVDILSFLFEVHDKRGYELWQVTEELYKIALTPLETENPFPPIRQD